MTFDVFNEENLEEDTKDDFEDLRVTVGKKSLLFSSFSETDFRSCYVGVTISQDTLFIGPLVSESLFSSLGPASSLIKTSTTSGFFTRSFSVIFIKSISLSKLSGVLHTV